MVKPGTPAYCKPTCNEEDEGVSKGSPPTCECTPHWYWGSCDEDMMKPDSKICRVQPCKLFVCVRVQPCKLFVCVRVQPCKLFVCVRVSAFIYQKTKFTFIVRRTTSFQIIQLLKY